MEFTQAIRMGARSQYNSLALIREIKRVLQKKVLRKVRVTRNEKPI